MKEWEFVMSADYDNLDFKYLRLLDDFEKLEGMNASLKNDLSLER